MKRVENKLADFTGDKRIILLSLMAVAKMLRHEIGRRPVVDRQNPKRLPGYLGRAGVMAARLKLHGEEHVREPGLLARRGKPKI